ncbi:hypothetical protein B0T14DRAFT_562091 [Immersiella caudata]|uniref:Uncharacterized protein n=1 Tax=Immersiella caudata TaxID=314043 RepID=A0AA39X2V6_9PEZI|nr:hypothetical protein B0T14DRAFT_562091 [Immersiella caudata]
MSYPSGNPYSRRPDDDRRPSDSNDRHRDSSSYRRSFTDPQEGNRDSGPSWSYSVPQGASRQSERDRDRDRGYGSPKRDGYDPPRAPSRQTSTGSSSKADTVAGRTLKGPSAPAGPTNQGGGNADYFTHCVDAAEKIAKLAAVKTQQATLDKALEQRRSDSNKTKHKHPDFPSIPELQNRYRHRDDRLRKELEDEEKKVRGELADALGQLPSNPPAPGPLVETQAHAKESQSQLQSLQKDVDSKIDMVSKALQAHQGSSKGASEVLKAQVEVLKKQLAELKSQEVEQKAKVESDVSTVRDALQKEINELREQSKLSQTQEAEQILLQLRQELLAQFNDQSSQLNSQLLELKRREDESKAQIERQAEETKAQLKRQDEALSAQLKQQQELIAQLKKQQEELSAQLTRHQEASTAEFEKQKDNAAKYSAKSSDAASSKDLAAIREENAKLKTDYDALRADFSNALLRVDELEKREGQRGERATSGENDFRALSKSVTACLQKVEEQAERVSKSEETLMNLDIQGLDDLGEVLVAFPQVQHQVRELQDGLRVQQEGLTALKGDVNRINGFNDEVLSTVGRWVDDLRKTDADQGTEVRALKEQIADMKRAGSNHSAPVEDSTTKAEVASVKKELDGFSVHTKEELDAVRKKNKETTEFLAYQISVLEQRYNNITTKEMAERILGVMETVYPNAKNIATTLKSMQNTIESQKMQLVSVEEEGKATKRRVSETESRCGKLEAMLEPIAQRNQEMNEQATREIDQHQHYARKRARKDGYPNGMGRSASNGVVYANGVNGEDHL